MVKSKFLTAGLDVGFGYVKISTRAKQPIKFPAIVSDVVDLTITEDMLGEKYVKNIPPEEWLHVEVTNLETNEANQYFFGDLAVKQGKNKRYLSSKDKSLDEINKIAGYVGLSLLTDATDQVYNIIAGCPIDEYKELKKSYAENYPGKYRIKYMSGPLKGEVRDVCVCKTKITPQGYGVYLDSLLDFNGEIVREDLTKGKILITDTGFKTTNVLCLEEGVPVMVYSKQLNDGIRNIFMAIQEELSNQGYQGYSLEDVESIYNQGYLEIENGETIDITKVKERATISLADTITKKINSMGNPKMFKKILVAGGGGIHLATHFNFEQSELVQNAQFANSNGYAKGAVQIDNSLKKEEVNNQVG